MTTTNNNKRNFSIYQPRPFMNFCRFCSGSTVSKISFTSETLRLPMSWLKHVLGRRGQWPSRQIVVTYSCKRKIRLLVHSMKIKTFIELMWLDVLTQYYYKLSVQQGASDDLSKPVVLISEPRVSPITHICNLLGLVSSFFTTLTQRTWHM